MEVSRGRLLHKPARSPVLCYEISYLGPGSCNVILCCAVRPVNGPPVGRRSTRRPPSGPLTSAAFTAPL